ncbi:MAG: hypothetical protein ACNA7T_07335 [Haliea sp.]
MANSRASVIARMPHHIASVRDQAALTLNLKRMSAQLQEQPVPLTVTEFRMGHTLSRLTWAIAGMD